MDEEEFPAPYDLATPPPPNLWTTQLPGQPPPTMLDLFILQNRLWLRGDDDAYTHLKMNGGKFRLPQARRGEFFAICAADVRSGNYNFVVEMPFAPDAPSEPPPAMRLVMDLDVDSPLGEVLDQEWHTLLGGILETVREVYADALPSDYSRRVIVLNAGVKHKVKEGRQLIKTGRHCVFPEIFITQSDAIRLREMIILRLQERQTLAHCVKLRAAKIEDILDKCIYENGTAGKLNGMRMAEMHKSHCCSQCKRFRKARNRAAMTQWVREREEARAAGLEFTRPEPKEVYYRFDECDKCFGRSFVYEGRPYSVYEVLSGSGAPLLADLAALHENLVTLYEQTCVRLEVDGTPPTRVSPILAALTREPANSAKLRKKQGKHAGGGAVAVVGRGAGAKWQIQDTSSEKAMAIDQFIYEKFRHKSMDDPMLSELQRSSPHGVSRWYQSRDGKIYLISSISTLCFNKARAHPNDPMHSRSQVYFIVSDDGSVVQRCHAVKEYNGGVSCKSYKSPPRWLPPEIIELLWPPKAAAGGDGDGDGGGGGEETSEEAIMNLVNYLYGLLSLAIENDIDAYVSRVADEVMEDNSVDGNGGGGGGGDGESSEEEAVDIGQ